MIEFNKVMLAGHLTRDPELRYLETGTAVCDLGLASGRTFFDKNSGTKREETLFIRVTAWAKTAEFCNQYMRKGKGIFVEGRLKLDTWKDKDGNNRERISVNADRIQFVESKGSGRDPSAPAEPDAGGFSSEESSTRPPAPAESTPGGGDPSSSDDLPF